MQLVKYNPFRELQKLDKDLDKFWDESWGLASLASATALDLYEEDGKLVAKVSLPNYSKEEIKVTTADGVLEISAEHHEKEEDKAKRRYYLRSSSNRYFRRVALPDNTEADKTEATFEDGSLKVTIPLTSPSKANEVVIK